VITTGPSPAGPSPKIIQVECAVWALKPGFCDYRTFQRKGVATRADPPVVELSRSGAEHHSRASIFSQPSAEHASELYCAQPASSLVGLMVKEGGQHLGIWDDEILAVCGIDAPGGQYQARVQGCLYHLAAGDHANHDLADSLRGFVAL